MSKATYGDQGKPDFICVTKILQELSHELNILATRTKDVKRELGELVGQKQNVYTFLLKPIEDYGSRLFLADQIDCNFKQLEVCRGQIDKIERIWSGLQF